mgnify:CR=1 FL=1
MHDLINNLPHRFTNYSSFINHLYETRTNSKCNINVLQFKKNFKLFIEEINIIEEYQFLKSPLIL